MPLPRPARPLTALPLVALALAGCSASSSPGTASSSTAPPGQVTVTASDTACTLSVGTAPAGVVTLEVTNTGSKVTEFYVYAEGDRVLGEVENIGPGLTRQLTVQVTEPATLSTACKPGMVGDGIRTPFTVTPAPASTSEKAATAPAPY